MHRSKIVSSEHGENYILLNDREYEALEKVLKSCVGSVHRRRVQQRRVQGNYSRRSGIKERRSCRVGGRRYTCLDGRRRADGERRKESQ